MALTREFRTTLQERAQQDVEFRQAMLKEGIENMLAGDVSTGKAILRDYINASVGFKQEFRCKHTFFLKNPIKTVYCLPPAYRTLSSLCLPLQKS